MSYNDDYMVWFRPRTVRHITRETSYWDTLVESQLRIMEKCEPGSEIYNDCINALRAVEELGRFDKLQDHQESLLRQQPLHIMSSANGIVLPASLQCKFTCF
nr:hypothetical protein CFP56_27278 [Quercus suber]